MGLSSPSILQKSAAPRPTPGGFGVERGAALRGGNGELDGRFPGAAAPAEERGQLGAALGAESLVSGAHGVGRVLGLALLLPEDAEESGERGRQELRRAAGGLRERARAEREEGLGPKLHELRAPVVGPLPRLEEGEDPGELLAELVHDRRERARKRSRSEASQHGAAHLLAAHGFLLLGEAIPRGRSGRRREGGRRRRAWPAARPRAPRGARVEVDHVVGGLGGRSRARRRRGSAPDRAGVERGRPGRRPLRRRDRALEAQGLRLGLLGLVPARRRLDGLDDLPLGEPLGDLAVVDDDEGGEPREELVLEREPEDLAARRLESPALPAVREPVAVLEVRDSRLRPELGQGVQLDRLGLDRLLEGPALGALGAHDERPGERTAPEEDGRRPPREEVGETLRRDRRRIEPQAPILDLDVVEDRRPYFLADAPEGVLERRARRAESRRPATEVGEPPQERGVHGRVDPERVDPDVRQPSLDAAEDLRLVPHLAVRDDHEDRQARRGGLELLHATGRNHPRLALEQREHALERRIELRAARGADPAEPARPLRLPAAVGRDEARLHPVRAVREGAESEPVLRLELVEEPLAGPLRRVHLRAGHGPRAVEEEDHVPGPLPCLRVARRHDGEEAEALPVLLRDEEDRLLLARGRLPAEHEVPVEELVLRPERDEELAALLRDLGRVLRAPELVHRLRRQDLDVDAQLHVAPEARSEPGRRDPRGVGDRRRVRLGPVAERGALEGLPRDVARRHDEREAELGLPVVERGEALAVHHLDGGDRARRQVPHLDREDVISLLLEERGLLPLRDRLVVLAPGLAPLLHDPDELLPVHVKLEPGHRGPAREGEDVDRLEQLGVRVLERLLDRDLRDALGDLRRERDGAEREREAPILARDDEAAAPGGVVLRRLGALVLEERDGREHGSVSFLEGGEGREERGDETVRVVPRGPPLVGDQLETRHESHLTQDAQRDLRRLLLRGRGLGAPEERLELRIASPVELLLDVGEREPLPLEELHGEELEEVAGTVPRLVTLVGERSVQDPERLVVTDGARIGRLRDSPIESRVEEAELAQPGFRQAGELVERPTGRSELLVHDSKITATNPLLSTMSLGLCARHCQQSASITVNQARTERRGAPTEQRGAIPERRGARTERRGARTERRGARTERRGARTERRGARKERRGARTERRGARTERRGARTERRGAPTERRSAKTVLSFALHRVLEGRMSDRRREKELKRRRKQAERARGPAAAPVAAAPPPNRELIARELGDPERLTLHIRRFSQLLATVDELEPARLAYPTLVDALLEVDGDEILALPEDQRGMALRSRMLPGLVSEHLAKMARQAIEYTASRAQDPMDRLALLAGRIFIDSWIRTKDAPEKNPGWEAIFGISVLDALFGGVVFSRLARAALVVEETEASRAFAKALARAEIAKELETLGLASPPEKSAATLRSEEHTSEL